MRRLALLIALPAALLLVAGCGGETVSPTAETVVGTLPQTTTQEAPELPQGDPAAGKEVYASAGCGGCHALEAAGSSGTVGPDLDDAQPELTRVQLQVMNGGGGMPPYADQLTEQQIADVSQFVYDSTHG